MSWLCATALGVAAVRWGEAAAAAYAADCAIGGNVSVGMGCTHALASAGVALRVPMSPVAGCVLGAIGIASAHDKLQKAVEVVVVGGCAYFIARKLSSSGDGDSQE